MARGWPRRLSSAGPLRRSLARGRGLLRPFFEPRLGDPRVLSGEERALARVDAEVARLRVGDDLARIVGRFQHVADELVEAELFGSRDLDDAVQRRPDG